MARDKKMSVNARVGIRSDSKDTLRQNSTPHTAPHGAATLERWTRWSAIAGLLLALAFGLAPYAGCAWRSMQ